MTQTRRFETSVEGRSDDLDAALRDKRGGAKRRRRREAGTLGRRDDVGVELARPAVETTTPRHGGEALSRGALSRLQSCAAVTEASSVNPIL